MKVSVHVFVVYLQLLTEFFCCVLFNDTFHISFLKFVIQERDQSKDLKLTRKVVFLLASCLGGKAALPEAAITKLIQVRYIPVSTQRRFDVETTLFGRQRRCYNVETTSYVY